MKTQRKKEAPWKDNYPEKDFYITQAEAAADTKADPKTAEWSRVFHRTMDRLLVHDGLRAL
jgi:hypothetical protein